MKVIGLIKILDSKAFDDYRNQVGVTLERYSGKVSFRGHKQLMPWNELGCEDFDAFVELEFLSADDALRWAQSPEYRALIGIRSKAMRLTLFGVQ